MEDFKLFKFEIYIFLLLMKGLHAEKSPNILLIISDDLSPITGSYGGPALTPNIDQLATQSIQFNNAFAQQALCGPSRTSFLTSRRPDTTRVYNFREYWRNSTGNFTTLPQELKQQGYYSYGISKVFHRGKTSNYNEDYPLSWSEPVYISNEDYYDTIPECNRTGSVDNDKLYADVLCPVNNDPITDDELADSLSAKKATSFIKEMSHKEQPFFLALGFLRPHTSFKFPKRYLSLYPEVDLAKNREIPKDLPNVAYSPWRQIRRYDDVKDLNLSFPYENFPENFQFKLRQHYYSAISFMDSKVGEVLNQLDESGLANNTIVIFTSDHGYSLGENGGWEKSTNKNRNSADKGKQTDALVELVDIFPSILDLAGLKIPQLCPLESSEVNLCTKGMSFKPIIDCMFGVTEEYNCKDQKIKWKTAVFSQYPRASNTTQWDSDWTADTKDIKIMGYSIRTESYRYTEWVEFNSTTFRANFSENYGKELYIHEFDPEEMCNQASNSSYTKLVKEMREKLILGWREAMPKTNMGSGGDNITYRKFVFLVLFLALIWNI